MINQTIFSGHVNDGKDHEKRVSPHIDGRIFVGFRLPGAELSCFPTTSLATSSRFQDLIPSASQLMFFMFEVCWFL